MAKEAKGKWRTVRCVVEYRTRSVSERDLAHHVQSVLDTSDRFGLEESKAWAKPFNTVVARMRDARPRKMQAALRALEAAVARMRKL